MGSPPLSDAAPLAASWASVADLGLKALDAMEKHRPLVLTTEEENALARAQAPVADVLLMVAPPVKKLVDAAK